MNRILLGWNVVLTVLLVALSVMLVQTADKVGDLEGELAEKENQYQSEFSAIQDELHQFKISVAYFLEQKN